MTRNFKRNLERAVTPAEGLARRSQLVHSERLAMRTGASGFMRCAETYGRFDHNQRWLAVRRTGRLDRVGDAVDVVSVHRPDTSQP